MAFCTLVEWNQDFSFDQLSGGDGQLPAGCLVRIVGAGDDGPRVIEVWESADDAKRFSEASAPTLGELQIPPPSRMEGFETSVFRAAV